MEPLARKGPSADRGRGNLRRRRRSGGPRCFANSPDSFGRRRSRQRPRASPPWHREGYSHCRPHDHVPAGARDWVARWAERGIAFQHAPVFMGPQNALEATGTMLASGDKARFDALSPALSKMTGKLLYLGPEPERAAQFKLLGNSYLMFLTAGLADFFALSKAFALSPEDGRLVVPTFQSGGGHPSAGRTDLAGESRVPSWELSMARKDARLHRISSRTASPAGVSPDHRRRATRPIRARPRARRLDGDRERRDQR